MPINPTSQAAGVDGDAVIDAAVSAHKTPEKFAHARGVFLVDPATGLPAAPAGTSGDASAANQLTEIARLEAIRDRLPSAGIYVPGTPRSPSLPVVVSVQTPAVGTNWAAFSSQACTSLDLINTGVASTSPSTIAAATNLRWRFVGQTGWITLREGASQLVVGITNANQVEIQRADGSNTQIPLAAIAYV